jgi:amino acid adenylation domain-containing protein
VKALAQANGEPNVYTQIKVSTLSEFAHPASFAQQRLWFLDRLNPGDTAYNVPLAIQLDGAMVMDAFLAAIRDVLGRHETFRTTFREEDGEPVQVVAPEAAIDIETVEIDPAATDADRQVQRLVDEAAGTAFDLSRGPLVRVRLVRVHATRHVLLITSHHIIVDGMSLNIVLDELATLYEARCTGSRASLPAPTIEYVDLTAWQREHLRGEVLASGLVFWKSRLAGSQDFRFPVDRRRSPSSHTGHVVTASLSSGVADAVHGLARAHSATPFIVLLAALKALLYRHTGQSDVAIGCPFSGRDRFELERVVGLCINTVVLRTTFEGSFSFHDLIKRVRETVLEAHGHQHVPFEKVVEAVNPVRSLSQHPLYQVMFNMIGVGESVRFLGLTSTTLLPATVSTKLDMTFHASVSTDGIGLVLEYNRDSFEASTANRLLTRLATLVTDAVTHPDRHLDALTLLDAAERHAVLVTPNEITREFRSRPCLHQLIEDQAATEPTRLALVGEDIQLTFDDLNGLANRLARVLVSRGAKPKDVIAICLNRSVEFIISLVAIHKAGCAYVPLDPTYPVERLAFLMGDAGVRLAITQSQHVAVAPRDGTSLVFWDRDRAVIERQAADNLDVPVESTDAAYVMYTSGTTGVPKGVVIEHRNVLNYTWGVNESLGQPAHCSYALVSTVAADLGNTSIFLALATGGTLHVLNPERASDGRAFAEYLSRHHVDVLKITPTHLAALLKAHHSRDVLPRRCLVLGGEAARLEWIAELQQLAPDCTIVNHYGPTETTVGALTYRVDDLAATLTSEGLPLGRPLANVKAYVLDPHGTPCPVGVPGELWIGGKGVARGYLNREDLTAERFLPDPFSATGSSRMYRTGDRVRWLSNGTLEFQGRFDNQVKVRGFRVELGEIESVLQAHPGVEQAVVLLREDVPGTQNLVAYVSGEKLEPASLRLHLSRLLPAHAVPSAFVTVQTWPFTSNGKLDRQALPAPSDADRARVDSPRLSPATRTEKRLAAIWCDLLGVSSVSNADDFFMLGGHSLLVMRLVHRVQEEFEVTLPPGALFEHSDLEALARGIDELARPATEPGPRGRITQNVLVKISDGGSGTPFYWVHGTGGEIFSYTRLSKYLAVERPVYGFSADWSQIQADATLEEMAAHYVKLLRGFQPRGPYHLGGFCSAALLVLEMGRQLDAQGAEVGVMTAIDYEVQPPSARGVNALWAFIRNVPLWVLDDAIVSGPRELLGRIRSKSRHVSALVTSALRDREDAAPLDLRDQIGMWRFPDSQTAMLRTHHRAIHSYQPKPFRGRVTLFLPRTMPLLGPWPTRYDPVWDWLAAGGVEVHQVPGSHSTMLGEPFAAVLARLLSSSLASFERQASDISDPLRRIGT